MGSVPSLDHQIRIRAFEWLAEQTAIHGDVLPRQLLAEGMKFEGERVPLLGPAGIFRPKYAAYPLSITTVPNSPYDDSFSGTNLLAYRYRGADPHHRDNLGLRRALEDRIPLIYFIGLVPGRYVAMWPVYVVGDEPSALTFTVAVDDLAASVESR
jgi:putative restriction endonuclease